MQPHHNFSDLLALIGGERAHLLLSLSSNLHYARIAFQ